MHSIVCRGSYRQLKGEEMAEDTDLGCPILAHLANRIRPSGYWDSDDGWVDAKTQTPFARLGSGSWRTAYLGPDKTVYKTVRPDDEANADEAQFFADHADANWIPNWHYFEESNVMAMQRYEHPSGTDFKGDAKRARQNRRRLAEIDHLTTDGKYQNLGLGDDGRIVLLDGNYNVDTR